MEPGEEQSFSLSVLSARRPRKLGELPPFRNYGGRNHSRYQTVNKHLRQVVIDPLGVYIVDLWTPKDLAPFLRLRKSSPNHIPPRSFQKLG